MPISSAWPPRSGAMQMRRSDSAVITDHGLAGTSPTAVSLSVLVPVYNERHLVETSLRRVLALQSPVISDLQVIAVDDGSRDGSGKVLDALQREDPRLVVIHHERNSGKGAAIRTALSHATGDVCIVHDADLEYNPGDIPALLRPFIEEGADAVFGSRYLAAPYRRALMYRHSILNRIVTRISNVFTDLDLTDVETCYKAVRTTLLRSIPLRSQDFRIEIELAMKLAKRRALLFEVPIRYLPRSHAEGKKIGAKDGVLALAALVRFALQDDLYHDDEYGSHILTQLERTRRFNLWLGDTLRPFVGDRVLEIGAGIGTLTDQLIPRDLYVASDINPSYLHYLTKFALGKPYLRVRKVDAVDPRDFEELTGQFDTVLMINVLEHVADPHQTLRNVASALRPGGVAIVLVPQGPGLYGSLDEALEHRERYTRAVLAGQLQHAGLQPVHLAEFNRTSVPAWWFNGRVLKRRRFSRVQLKMFDVAVPIVRRIDRFIPWAGQSLVAVGRKP
jgi:2-polyprenyl-3-methyl-5-hydroxy-6-metoxy-1,4-benzoquinol methylase